MIDRTALIKGPARAVYSYNSAVTASCYHDKEIDWSVDPETQNIEPDALGKIDERYVDAMCKASFAPDGQFNDDIIAAFWPYLNYQAGQSMLGCPAALATDKSLAFHGQDTSLTTIVNAFVSKMPDIQFGIRKSLLGNIEFTGFRQNTKGWTDDKSLIDLTGVGTFAQAGFTPSLIKRQDYTLAWGAVDGFTAAITEQEEGFTLTNELQSRVIKLSTVGSYECLFKSVAAMLKCKPVNPTMAQTLAKLSVQGGAALMGQSLSANGAQLTLTGADGIVYLTIPNAALKTAGFKFGATVLRQGEFGFVATRTYDGGGVQQPLYTLAAS